MGKDATETKLDDLLGQVTSIVEKQRVEELEKKRREERLKQKQWEQKYRLGSFRRRARLPGPPDTDTNIMMTSMSLAPDDPRMMQLSPLPALSRAHRRQSFGDYSGQRASIGEITARLSGEGGVRRPSITDGRMDQPGTRTSLNDHSGRLSYLDGRRPSIGEHAGFGPYRQPSTQRYDRLERQRTFRSMSPVRFDAEPPSSSRYLRGHHSPSRYDVDDPYVRSLSPVRYDQGIRSPARSRHGSDPDIVGIITVGSSRREIPTRDLSSMLSPRYPDSRQASPRGAMAFFPDSESIHSFRGDVGPLDRSSEEYPVESLDGPMFAPHPDFPTREREMDSESIHSADYGRYERP
ncbi:inositol 1 4 5-trisphosphate receptor type 1 [Biomphalaria glabrata]|nr:inositol 1; 4; 5-trisphosphate receptor type 1 [Biomphalaria glabrata]